MNFEKAVASVSQNIQNLVNTRYLRYMAVLFVALFSIGCAQVSKTVDSANINASTEGLVQQTEALPTLVYIRPDAPSLSNYSKFIINPVKADNSNPNIQQISKQELVELQDYLLNAMTESLTEGGYQVVTAPSESTLAIGFTITDMKLPTSATNVSLLVVPGLSTSVGEVTVEATFTDAASGQLNAVVVESSRGSYLFNSNPLTTTSDVTGTFDSWAEGFKKSLDVAHGKSEVN